MKRYLRPRVLFLLSPQLGVIVGLGLLWSLSPLWWFAVICVAVVVAFGAGHRAGSSTRPASAGPLGRGGNG